MKQKSNKFIESRDNITFQIQKYWHFIETENVMPKKLIREHDLKVLFEEIKNLAEERTIAKLKLACINLGLKKFSDLPIDSIQYDIFKLGELKEIKKKLEKVPTINPVLKAKKGKKALNRTEVLTSNWIKARIKELDIQIIEINEKLTKFNDETEFDDSTAPMSLVA